VVNQSRPGGVPGPVPPPQRHLQGIEHQRGIDLAPRLFGDNHGAAVAARVARSLVVPTRRNVIGFRSVRRRVVRKSGHTGIVEICAGSKSVSTSGLWPVQVE